MKERIFAWLDKHEKVIDKHGNIFLGGVLFVGIVVALSVSAYRDYHDPRPQTVVKKNETRYEYEVEFKNCELYKFNQYNSTVTITCRPEK